MFNNVSFVGGIHGVGKSTICRHICNEINLEYLVASELLKWGAINTDAKNKKVNNINDTQNRLIIGLSNTIVKEKSYILDGHYCLLNAKNEIVDVPLDTFIQIKPVSLNIVLGDIAEIKERLEKRDNKSYDKDLMSRMQESELKYAKQLSKVLGLSLTTATTNGHSDLLKSLQNTFKAL